MSHTNIKVGMIGLGRIGKSHAQNLLQTVGCELTAACSIVPAEIVWAKENLPNIHVYQNYNDILQSADVDAVFIASTTSVHAEQIVGGLRAGKHVFCEKPLGISAQECKEVVPKIKKYQKDKILMIGFVRRYDPSYAFAKQQIEEGVIGEPFMVRAQTADHNDFATFQVEFVKTSGGIFHDMNVHDIDIARWFLGTEPINAYAIGSSFVHKEFEGVGDADNTTVSSEFEQDKMAFISASRTAFNGHDTRAEIFGTKGILRIGYTPSTADVEILDKHGIRQKCAYTFYDRFSEAFRLEAQAFIDCILGNTKPKSNLEDALQATITAEAFTRSFKEKRVVNISEIGSVQNTV